MDAETQERFGLIESALVRITAVQETQAGLITGIGRHVNQLAGQVDKLVTKVDALVDSHTRLYASMQELAEAQRTTERTLQAFIESLRKGTNGNP